MGATNGHQPVPDFQPVQVEERELGGDPAPLTPRTGPDGRPYAAARVLIRLHSQPVGLVDVELPPEGLDGGVLLEAAKAQLGRQLRRHLEADGVDTVDAARALTEPSCVADRRAVLASPPFASVVVPTRDQPDLLRRLLGSLLELEYPAERFEVVVADNVPTDDRTRAEVERAGERVKYVHAPRPGSASARNEGAARAEGEFVAFVDDDEVVDRHWLAELVAGFRAVPDASAVTGLVLPAELDTHAQALFEEYGGFGKGFRPAVFDIGPNRPDHPLFPFVPGMVGSGNNVAFRRAALPELGGYDAFLGNGTPTRSGEDWELFLRLLRGGHVVAYRPSAIIHHRHRRDYRELREQLAGYGVGLSAALTRTVAHDPRAAVEIARRLRHGVWFALSSRSPKNETQSNGYPRDLRLAELAGMARGPLAYARSRRRRG